MTHKIFKKHILYKYNTSIVNIYLRNSELKYKNNVDFRLLLNLFIQRGSPGRVLYVNNILTLITDSLDGNGQSSRSMDIAVGPKGSSSGIILTIDETI